MEPQGPKVSEDPFGALNAVAQQGAQARGPEIVIVNDGKGVESVERQARWIGIAKIGGIALVPLILGIIVGQISQSAKTYNKTIHDASEVADDMDRVRGKLQDVHNALLAAKDRGKGTYDLADTQLTEELTAISKELLTVIDPDVVYKSYLYELDPDEVTLPVMEFYALTQRLALDLDRHVKKAENDQRLIAAGKKQREKAKPDAAENIFLKDAPYRYGVYYHWPTKEEAQQGITPGAYVVEIGPPVCGDNKMSQTGTCPDGNIQGFGVRRSLPGDGWSPMAIHTPDDPEADVPQEKLLPMVPTGTIETLLKGTKATAAEIAYDRRLAAIAEIIEPLITNGANLAKRLRSKASSGEKFTFFL